MFTKKLIKNPKKKLTLFFLEPSLLFWTLLWQTGLEKVTSQFSDCQICLEVFSLVIHRKEYLR